MSTDEFAELLSGELINAAPSRVDDGLRASAGAHGSGRLLDEAHVALAGTSNDYLFNASQSDDAASYLAASCLAHYADGWSYLGASCRAALAGDFPVAKHLVYYAELRAANSVLARHGVLVRNKNHVLIYEPSGVGCRDGNGTHATIWPTFSDWAKTSQARKFVLGAFQMWGKSAEAWMKAQSGRANNGATVAQLLSKAGLDLKKLSTDQLRRNAASYGGPHLREKMPRHTPTWFTAEIQDIWGLIAPDGARAFEQLDRIMGSRLLNAHWSLNGGTAGSNRHAAEIDMFVSDIGATQPKVARKFIVDEARQSHSRIIGLAFGQSVSTGPQDEYLGMLGRALVLCRLASSAAVDLISSSQVDDNGGLGFWLSNIAGQYGYWGSTETPTTMELFDEIKDAVVEIVEFANAADLKEFKNAAESFVVKVGSLGVVATWIRDDLDSALPAAA